MVFVCVQGVAGLRLSFLIIMQCDKTIKNRAQFLEKILSLDMGLSSPITLVTMVCSMFKITRELKIYLRNWPREPRFVSMCFTIVMSSVFRLYFPICFTGVTCGGLAGVYVGLIHQPFCLLILFLTTGFSYYVILFTYSNYVLWQSLPHHHDVGSLCVVVSK